MKDIYRLGGMAAILLLVFGGASWFYLRSQDQDTSVRIQRQVQSDPQIFERPHSRSLGPVTARVTVTEFFDPECESCRAVHEPMKQLLGMYPQSVRLVMRYMPFHQNSVYAAGALEAAGAQGRYFEMLDILFKNQGAWGDHQTPRPELIPAYARQIGLDMEAFDAFIAAERHREIIDTDRRDGEALGVVATPSFFVNQKPLRQLSLGGLKDMIDRELSN